MSVIEVILYTICIIWFIEGILFTRLIYKHGGKMRVEYMIDSIIMFTLMITALYGYAADMFNITIISFSLILTYIVLAIYLNKFTQNEQTT